MNYRLIQEVVQLVEQFEKQNSHKGSYESDITSFKKWIVDTNPNDARTEPEWSGKDKGRSPESVINTLIVHMNRYAKSYSKSAIAGSEFSTQEDFIYLINLKAFGAMTKMDLIRKNVHEKSVGMQIISRLIAQGWVDQKKSKTDKRSKVICINAKGSKVLEKQMNKIRKAAKIVTGNLSHAEKMELIRLLNKLNDFHLNVYDKNYEPESLIDEVMSEYDFLKN